MATSILKFFNLPLPMHLLKHKNTKIALGLFAFLIVVALAFKGDILNLLGAAKYTGPVLKLGTNTENTQEIVVKGAKNVRAVYIYLTAQSTSDIKVTSLKFTGYMNEDAEGEVFKQGTDNGVPIKDIAVAVRIQDEQGNPITTKTETFDSDGTVFFTNLNWVIPAGSSKTVVIYTDIDKSATPHNEDPDEIAFDIKSPLDITAIDVKNGNAVPVVGRKTPNGGNRPLRTIYIMNSGRIHPGGTSENPVLDDKKVAGTSEQILVARHKIHAEYEPFKVVKMTFTNDGNEDNSYESDSLVKKVTIKYPTSFEAPNTLDGIAETTLVNGSATFTDLNIAVPQSPVSTDDNAIEVELYVTTNPISNDPADGRPTGSQVEMEFDAMKTFMAYGQNSGTQIANTSDVAYYQYGLGDAEEFAFYKTLPRFEKDNSSDAPCPTDKIVPSIESPIYCFKVSADPSSDIGLYKLTFELIDEYIKDEITGTNVKLYEYDIAGATVGEVKITQVSLSPQSSPDINELSLKFEEQVVSKNQTKYYVLKFPIEFETSTENSTLKTRLLGETMTAHSASTAATSVSGRNVWSDRSNASHSTSTADWTDSYMLEYLPTDYLELSES